MAYQKKSEPPIQGRGHTRELENWDKIRSLRSFIRNGEGLNELPKMIKSILLSKSWQNYTTPNGDHFEYQENEWWKFVSSPPEAGLGSSQEQLLVMCPSLIADLDDEKKKAEKQGNRTDLQKDNLLYNIQKVKAPSGTSRTAFHRRLKKSRPDLDTKVRKGELSANAAMIEAGFRKPTATVPKTREAFASYIKRTFSPVDILWIKGQL